MSSGKHIEIACPACGQDALLVRQARYEGLTRVGEELSCSACGHTFASEEDVPFKQSEEKQVFTEADREEKVELFHAEEKNHLCRYCAEYVVNPFMQWCGFHKKEVEATDTCEAFRPAEKDEQSDGEQS